MNFKCLITIATVLWLVILSPHSVQADINDTMDSMFNSMINVTAPDAHLSARRGIIDGGSVTVRNRIVNFELINFNPPKFSAGCGGIDVFNGSFSFINSDQFVNALRAIASNAISYAFQLALAEMCPSCIELIGKLRAAAAKMNEWAGNSCKAAQEVVGFVGEQLPGNFSLSLEKGPIGSLAKGLGGYVDDFNAMFPTPGQTLGSKSMTPAQFYDGGITGNIAYRVLTEGGTSSASSWIVGNDSALIEELISLTGTVIIIPVDPASDPDAGEMPPHVNLVKPILAFQDFIGVSGETRDVQVYQCVASSTNCMVMTPTNVTGFVPMAERVRYLLLGNIATGEIGIVDKFAYNIGTGSGVFTADQRALMDILPDVAKNIRDLARTSAGAARKYGDLISEQVGLMLAESLIDELVSTVTIATAKTKHEGLGLYQNELNKLKEDITAQKQLVHTKFKGNTSSAELYSLLMSTNKKLTNLTNTK